MTEQLELPHVEVDLDEAYLLATGRAIERSELTEYAPGTEAVAILAEPPDPFMDVLAMTEVQVGGWLKPRSVFSATRDWVEAHYKSTRSNRPESD